MSVINQMLRDLDRQQTGPIGPLHERIAPVPESRPRRWPWLVLVLVGILAGMWFWPAPPAAPVGAVSAEQPPPKEPAPNLAPVEPATVVASATPAPAMPVASVPSAQASRAPVAARHEPAAEPAPARVAAPTAAPETPADAPDRELAQADASSVREEPARAEPTPAPMVLHKTPSRAPAVSAESAYQEGLEALNGGRNDTAEAAWSRALTLDPEHAGARAALATLALQAGRYDAVLALVEPALAKVPTDPTWRLLKARALIGQNQPEAAWRLLVGSPPALGEDREYHAVLAALDQQLGHAEAAVERYRALAAAAPTEATYWLGLGLALDASGRGHEAVAAYRRALDLNQLGGAARAHAERRVAGG